MITHNGAPLKGNTNTIVGGTDLSHTIDRECLSKDNGSSTCQRAATSAWAPSLYKGQILQMLTDVKEQMKEQQVQTNHDRKQAALNCDNTAREQEPLKQHND